MVQPLTFGSLFTGVGGFDVGLERNGAKCVWQVERDKQCNSVLEKHWPGMQRLDDVRDVTTNGLIRPDWICGGFPCQDLSVAGKRAGLAGDRSGLFFEFVRIIREFSPAGFLIENVPGLLSSNERRDMGIVLGSLAELGYGFAYRVYDAQYFRVAQRRRRVFIVGCIGNWRRAAEILFESESVPWNPAPRRAKGARTAASLTAGSASGSGVNRPGRRCEDDVNIALCLNGKNGNRFDGESETFITHALSAEGADASEDGTGRGTPLIPIPFDERNITSRENRSNPQPGDPCHTLHSAASSVAYAIQERAISENPDVGPQGKGWQEDTAFTLEARHHQQAVVGGFKRGQGAKARTDGYQVEQSPTLTASDSGTQQSPGVHIGMAVRRLTPRECERLQGFPDDWTRYGITGNMETEISDSARYRMLGNAVCVNVAEFIGRRLMATQPRC